MINSTKTIIAGIGHRNINPSEFDSIKDQIKGILLSINNPDLVIRTNLAFGADLLIAECAKELNIDLEVVLPLELDDYILSIKEDSIKTGYSFSKEDENKLINLFNYAKKHIVLKDEKNTYLSASENLISSCDKAIVIWDNKEYPLIDENNNPINIGGTYHSLCKLKEKLSNNDIYIISCTRTYKKPL